MKGVRAHAERLWRYQRYWRADLILAGFLIAVSVGLSLPMFDLAVAGHFLQSGMSNSWPLADTFPWNWLYAAPRIALGLPVAAALLYLLVSTAGVGNHRYRVHCVFLLLAIWLGSGLVSEGVLKANWGRPRPLEVDVFGGSWPFRPVWSPGVAGRGRSFPCGHSAAVFTLTALYFMLRRHQRRSALLVLTGVLAFGWAVGLTRLRVGGHYLSDVAWSASIAFTVNLLLYYGVINVPAREDADPAPSAPLHRWRSLALLIVIPLLLQLAVAAASPIYKRMVRCVPEFAESQGGALELLTDLCPLEIEFVDEGPLKIMGELFGHGLPWARYETSLHLHERGGIPQAQYRCWTRGLIFHKRGKLRIVVPSAHIYKVIIDAGRQPVDIVAIGRLPDHLTMQIWSGGLRLPPQWNETGPVKQIVWHRNESVR
ncbi:MAG: phosphatase PAP2 family protein [Lentisphaerae bacterium]|nr:phosphatase PAP2 family protein [Lentisphaerota bacterium]